MKKTLKLTDVARHLTIPRRTLYDMIKDGRFAVPPITNSKPRRWNIEDVEAWRFADNRNTAIRSGD